MILVAAEVVVAINAHIERSIRPEREIVGALRTEPSLSGRHLIVVEYIPLRNWGRGDGTFTVKDTRLKAWGGEYLPCHTHPSAGVEPKPSDGDFKGAHETWFEKPYAIYHYDVGLRFYMLMDKKRCIWERIEWRFL